MHHDLDNAPVCLALPCHDNMARKSPLTALSDDDGEDEGERECKRRRVEYDSDEDGFHAVVVKAEGAQEQSKQKRKQKRERRVVNPVALKTSLTKLCQKLCVCARNSKNTRKSSCFRQFHGGGVEALYQLRLQLSKLSKQDCDNKAWGGNAKCLRNIFKAIRFVFAPSLVIIIIAVPPGGARASERQRYFRSEATGSLQKASLSTGI